MILHSITIDNVRAIEHLEITDIPATGVLVVSGENEAGKSTILDALHTVLHIRHSSTARRVKGLQPVGRDVGPRIQLEASVGPYRFRIDKTYLRKKSAELQVFEPNVERLAGADAEQRLEAILNEYLDNDLFEVMLMRQGQADAQVEAVGIPSLVAALDQGQREEVVDDSALMERINAEYRRYFTEKTGATTGELKAAEADAERHAEQMRQAKRELDELAQYVRRHEQATAQLEDAQLRRPAAEEELRTAKRRHAEATAAQERIDRAQERVAAAQAEVDLAQAAVTARARIEQTLQQACDSVTALQSRTDELECNAAQERQEKAKLTERLATARDQERAAAEALRAAQEMVQCCRDNAALQAARKLAATLEAAEKLVAKCRAEVPQRPIEQRDVQRVEQAELQLRTKEIERDAAAATLTLSALEATDVTVDGQPVTLAAAGTEFALAGKAVVQIGPVRAVIRAGRAGQAANREVERAREQLQALLASLGDFPNAQAVRDACRDHEARSLRLREAERELRAAQPADETLTQLQARIERLNAQDLHGLPALANAEEALGPARDAYEAATATLAKIRAELDAWSESGAQLQLQVHHARVEDAQRAKRRAEQEFASAEQLEPKSSLLARVQAAEHRHAEAVAKVAQLRQAGADLERAQAFLLGARTQLKNLADDELAAQKTLAELTGRINQAAGVAERFEQASAAAKRAEVRFAASRRRADAVRLLRATLRRHQEVARQKYAQPFVDALTHFAKPIFGNDVGFTLTDTLQIEGREVKNIPLNIAALSGGAQEQLAILTRLAIAQLVSDDGVPVIIDDALGNTDSERLSVMSTLLSDLGRTRQVFILTCDQNRYIRVANARRFRMDELRA